MVPLIIGGLVAVKVVNVIGAPTSEGVRRTLLTHAYGTFDKLREERTGPKNIKLSGDLETLRQGAANGWKMPAEHLALARVSGFVAAAHIKATGVAIFDIADNYCGALADLARKSFNRPQTDADRHY